MVLRLVSGKKSGLGLATVKTLQSRGPAHTLPLGSPSDWSSILIPGPSHPVPTPPAFLTLLLQSEYTGCYVIPHKGLPNALSTESHLLKSSSFMLSNSTTCHAHKALTGQNILHQLNHIFWSLLGWYLNTNQKKSTHPPRRLIRSHF